MADYITTFKKIHFAPLEPKSENIMIEDIAHALSQMTRANGHFPEFYSVAQHSIQCCEEAKARGYSKKIQIACLLHDASEAYLSDITSPVKRNLSKYVEIEDRLQGAIYQKFLEEPLLGEESQLITEIDNAMFYYEFYHFMNEKKLDTVPIIESNPIYDVEAFQTVEKRFLYLFKGLVAN